MNRQEWILNRSVETFQKIQELNRQIGASEDEENHDAEALKSEIVSVFISAAARVEEAKVQLEQQIISLTESILTVSKEIGEENEVKLQVRFSRCFFRCPCFVFSRKLTCIV